MDSFNVSPAGAFFIDTHLGFGGFPGRGGGSSIGSGGRGGLGGSSIGLGGLPGGLGGSSPGLGGAGICKLYGKDKTVESGCIIFILKPLQDVILRTVHAVSR